MTKRFNYRANFLAKQCLSGRYLALSAVSVLVLAALGAACSSESASARNTGGASGNPSTGGQNPGPGPGPGPNPGPGDPGPGLDIGGSKGPGSLTNEAFPAEPIIDTESNPPINPSEFAVFANPDDFSPGGVCVFEPHLSDANGPGAVFPKNWLRPRFRWTAPAGPTLWEIRLKAGSQKNDLVIYTRRTQFALPKENWEQIAKAVYDPITVTIRGAGPSGMVGARGDFRVINVLAGGSLVFWATTSSVVQQGSSRLLGFTMGDEAVVETLRAEQVTGINGIVQGNGRDLRGESVSSAVTGIPAGAPRCIGCHTATPDGTAVAFTDDYPWNQIVASVEQGTAGTVPTYVSAGARELMKMPFLGASTMLPGPWMNGDRTLITTMGRRSNYIYVDYSNKPEPLQHDLIWIDLQTTATIPSSATLPAAEGAPGAPPWPDDFYSGSPRDEAMKMREQAILAAKGTGWGVLATEPSGSISNPNASHDGTRIAYTVSESSVDGHPDWHNNTADIKILTLSGPRAAATGGTPLMGASSPQFLEYYPAFSSDDAFIAFTRAPAPSNLNRCRQGVNNCQNSPASLGENPDGPYYNRKGEIYVVRSTGGEPHRLRANDPVACSGETSPGVLNSWPKWSSTFREEGGKRYYFIIFSSARSYPGQFNLQPTMYTPPIETKSSQLYMGVLEEDIATGALTSYPALYLWNQGYLATGVNQEAVPLMTSNLTPAWEDFEIPEVPPVIIPR